VRCDIEPSSACLAANRASCADPFFELDPSSPANITTDGYHRNLRDLRAAALAADVPFWNFFNAMPFNSHLAPSHGQIAWQAFTSLAYGAKGVLYFVYWTPGASVGACHRSLGDACFGDGFGKGGGLVSPVSLGIDAHEHVFEPTLQYAYASRVNARLHAFGTFLLGFTSEGVWRPHREGTAGCAIAALNETDASGKPGAGTPAQGEYLVGQFVLRGADGGAPAPAGSTALVVVNQRHDIELWPTVRLADPAAATRLREVDATTGAVRAVRDDSPNLPGLQMALAPGYARLLLLLPS
jgi:hypothetical protein